MEGEPNDQNEMEKWRDKKWAQTIKYDKNEHKEMKKHTK